MKTRVTLVIEITHRPDYDPVGDLVWYLADSDEPEPPTMSTVSETWEDVMEAADG